MTSTLIVTLVTVIAAVTMVLAAVPGPNDLRYPDVIVEPKVICDKEGVFHHPRNCSWYIRCVDRMNIGYFWTYHFECEPGTVFSDELDQCIFPYLIGPPCGTAGVSAAVPVPSSPAIVPTTPARPAPTTPAPTTPKPTTPKPTTPAPTTPAPTTPAPTTPAPTTPKPTTPKPTTPAPTTPAPTTPITTTTITSPSVPDNRNFTCAFSPGDCAATRPCLPNEQVGRTLCTGCYANGLYITAFYLCGEVEGKLFDPSNNVCVDDPDLNPNCSPAPTTPAPTTPKPTTPAPTTVPTTTTVKPEDFNVSTENNVVCSFDNMRPAEDWILDKFCQSFFLCTPDGRYKGSVKLCDNYYQCVFRENDDWDLTLMSCKNGLLFSYDEDECVSEPSDEEKCLFDGR